MRVVIVLAWCALMALYLLTAPLLPAELGEAGKQMHRFAYLAVMMGVSSFTVFIAGGTLMRALARRWPMAVNLPHRSYWLAPERREASIERLASLMDGMRLLTLAMFAGLHIFLLWQARPEWPQPPAWLGMVAIAALVLAFLGWVIRIHRAFPAPPTR
ncbi:hypothetical protein ACFJGW_07240 [Burkholderiaceae bacterium UC74_6]